MNETLTNLLAMAAGVVLGVIFFGGLWWTVRKGTASPRPAIWFLGSLIVRMSVVIPGFFFVGQGKWQRFVACLVGFVLARIAVILWTRASVGNRKKGHHAS
jgi:F1F0 ATPase subunit 2